MSKVRSINYGFLIVFFAVIIINPLEVFANKIENTIEINKSDCHDGFPLDSKENNVLKSLTDPIMESETYVEVMARMQQIVIIENADFPQEKGQNKGRLPNQKKGWFYTPR